MAKTSVVQIQIFGVVKADENVFFDLALAAAAASSSAPWSSGYSADDFVDELKKAEEEQRAIRFEIHDNWDVFEELRQNCQAAGLAYVAYTAVGGEPGWSGGISFRPGMKEEFEFAVRGENAEPVVPAGALRAAQNEGPDAVAAILDALAANTRIGAITIDPEFLQSYETSVADGAQPAASPRP
jgi:hypothetical protein|nr:hypothetical protein [Neorhizobium tomejilense]